MAVTTERVNADTAHKVRQRGKCGPKRAPLATTHTGTTQNVYTKQYAELFQNVNSSSPSMN